MMVLLHRNFAYVSYKYDKSISFFINFVASIFGAIILKNE